MNLRKIRSPEEQAVLNEFYGFEVGDFTAMGKGPILMAREIVRLRKELKDLQDAILLEEPQA